MRYGMKCYSPKELNRILNRTNKESSGPGFHHTGMHGTVHSITVLRYPSYIHLGSFVCHIPVVLSVLVAERWAILCFSNQTDQGDETEGLEMEGLEMER